MTDIAYVYLIIIIIGIDEYKKVYLIDTFSFLGKYEGNSFVYGIYNSHYKEGIGILRNCLYNFKSKSN